MANYVSLDDAARLLNVSTDELIEMISRREIFGFRDGNSWKFKSEEIDRVGQERSGNVLDEDAGNSSLLLSERSDIGSRSGSILGGDSSSSKSSLSDLRLEPDEEDSDEHQIGSDVALIPDPSSGSGVRLVNRGMPTPPPAPADDDDEILSLDDDDSGELEIDASSLSLGPGNGLDFGSDLRLSNSTNSPSSSGKGSDVLAGSDLRLQSADLGGTPDLIKGGDSDADIDIGGALELAGNEDDLVLGSSSDLGLGADSGINLMSPSDSGLSLEDEPLDLVGTGISGLDLGSEGSGSDVGGSDPKSGVGSGISGIDFAAAEDFQLSPSDGMEIEEDSGSQVIEIEDSSAFADPFASQQDPFATGADNDNFTDDGSLGVGTPGGSPAGVGAYRAIPEAPLHGWEVATLLLILMIFGMSGIVITDIVRNMWSWSGESSVSVSSWFTELFVTNLGLKTNS